MTKPELRKLMLESRRSIAPADKQLWDRQIFQRAHKDRGFQLAGRVHVFMSTSEEIDTMPFIEYAWAIGKSVFVPRMTSTGTLEHVQVSRTTRWQANHLGINEPLTDSNEVTLLASGFQSTDVVIVPVLAFDVQGNRLGYGKGYYDAFLATCPAQRIGIAYESQKVKSVPVEDHDVRIASIASNERWYREP